MEPAPPRAGRGRRHDPTMRRFAIAAAAMAVVAIAGDGGLHPVVLTATLIGLVPWALIGLGWSVPLWVLSAVGLATGAVAVIVGNSIGALFPLLIVLLVVARRAEGSGLVWAALIGAVAILPFSGDAEKSALDEGAFYFLGGYAITVFSGHMRRRQELLTSELQRLHEEALAHAATTERAHIAREVHDVVAHSLTVVMLHLTGARRILRTNPERADEALRQAETVGRASLDSVRTMVGLLRSDQDDAAGLAAPQPGAAELAELIERSRSGGLDVDADIAGTDELDADQQLVVYRVVQESLSNVAQHAPGARCRVVVHPPTISVQNEPAVRPVNGDARGRRGLGLVGMAERVRAAGGELVTGARPDGGWAVEVTLPDRRAPSVAVGPS